MFSRHDIKLPDARIRAVSRLEIQQAMRDDPKLRDHICVHGVPYPFITDDDPTAGRLGITGTSLVVVPPQAAA